MTSNSGVPSEVPSEVAEEDAEETRSPVGVMAPEEQVSDPEEDVEPYADDDEEENDDGSVPEMGIVLHQSERTGEADEGDAPKEAAVEAAVSIFAELIDHVVRKGSTGRTFTMTFEVDSAAADDFIQLIGEQSFSAVFDRLEIARAGVTIKGVPTRRQENAPMTRVVLDITEDQIPLAGRSCTMVGQTKKLELFPTQLAFDLTKKAE
jgi:hypothetical protein